MIQTGEGKKVVTTPDMRTDLDVLVDEIGKLLPAPKAKMDTTPHWFIRHTRAGGREYQQVCRHIYMHSGARRLQVAKVIWPEVKMDLPRGVDR